MNYPNYGAPQQYPPAPPNPYQQPPAGYPQQPQPNGQQYPPAPPYAGTPGQFFGNQPQPPQQPPAPPAQNGQPPQGWTPDQPSAPEPQDGGDTSSFFGGPPSLSFAVKNGYALGTFRGGFVTAKTKAQQTDPATKALKTFPDGNPRMQLVLTVKTAERADPADDGERRLYVGGSMVKAVGAALKQANLNDVTSGCWIYVAKTGEKPPTAPGLNGEGVYTAVVAGPGQPDPGPGLPQHQAQSAPPQQHAPTNPQYATPAQHQQFAPQFGQGAPAGPAQPTWDGQAWNYPQAPAQPQQQPPPAGPPQQPQQFDPNQWSSPVAPQQPQGPPAQAYQPPAGYPQQPQQPPGWTPFPQ